MSEQRVITGAKILKGPKIEVSYLMGADRIPMTYGPSTVEPHPALVSAFAALDPHAALMMFAVGKEAVNIAGKKNEVKRVTWKPAKPGEEEEWIGDDWRAHAFELKHSKSGDGIILGFCHLLPNGKADNNSTPLYRNGEENGYEYLEGLLEGVKACERELFIYMDKQPAQQQIPFPDAPVDGTVVMEFNGNGNAGDAEDKGE